MRISDWSSDVCSSDLRLCAEAPVEPELDRFDAASGCPGLRDGIAALGLCGGCEDHFGDTRPDAVEAPPEQIMILPDLSSGADHHRSLGEVLLPAFTGSSGEEVAGVDHRRGDASGDPGSDESRAGKACGRTRRVRGWREP